MIIDNFDKNIDEKLLSVFNQAKQLEKFIVINSVQPLNKENFYLKDQSRINSLLFVRIELPTDDLLQVIITKSFSDEQINIDPKILILL